jgi:hypothetical protein
MHGERKESVLEAVLPFLEIVLCDLFIRTTAARNA